MTVMKAAALAALLAAPCVPSQAAETITGRWAADASACSYFGAAGQSPLVVTGSAVHWRDDACRIGRMYKTGDTVHIEARCWNFAGERSIAVSLRPHGGLLQLTWDRVRRGELRRCL